MAASNSKTGKAKSYWLVKTEPSTYSIDDWEKEKDKTTFWDGVRNYQARNTLRDLMKLGDEVLVYHSNAEPPEIVGVAKVVREGYPDFTALDTNHPHYDPDSTSDNPRWFMVDLKLIKRFKKRLSLAQAKEINELSGMELLRKGSRLSVQPVKANEFQAILEYCS
ncbi:MAG: EVE domain-containing protein [Planctomycetaceae bacterium]|nr:EVE domain-containing protein [Planctomycetaceae bacterium]MBN8602020.1 EVE domain-containing protein [Planctomycetota bacterium]